MNVFKLGLSIWICLLAWAVPSQGQSLPDAMTQGGAAAPASGIIDSGGFFARDPIALKRISESILKLKQDCGYQIYLVVEPVLITSTAPELAAQLRQAWLPDGNGLVVVFESDSRNVGIGRDMTGIPDQQDTAARIPTHEADAMLTRALEATDVKLAPEPYLEAFVGNLTREFDRYFKLRSTPPPAERTMKIGLLVVGTLSLLGLVGIGLGCIIRHSSMTGVRSFRFPLVDRPERLGATCGASVTARRFAPKG